MYLDSGLDTILNYTCMFAGLGCLLNNKITNFHRFHLFVFDDVLEVAKKFCVFNGMLGLYVVPLYFTGGSYLVDWAVMHTYKSVRPVAPLSDEVR